MNKMRRAAVLITGVCALLALCVAPGEAHIRLVYNPTTSAPKGWYVLAWNRKYRVGDYVLAHLPNEAAKLADERHYLPSSIPILKRIGAIGRQVVCLIDDQVLIDGHVVARALARDGAGRNLSPWAHCRALASDEFFLLSLTNPASFDSRYFGPVLRINVIGKANPLWTW
jgi:conjugative transfer signal peptidase TraF